MTRPKTGILHRYWFWPVVITTGVVIIGLLTFFDVRSPLRSLLALAFLLLCPGMAFVPLLRLRYPVAEWTLAIALSIAIDAIVAGIMIYSGRWSPAGGVALVIGISLIGVILQLLIPRSSASSANTPS